MKRTARPRGRPRTSALGRPEQLRAAKRAQRRRERAAGIATLELRLPREQAKRLRVAASTPSFQEILAGFLDEIVLDVDRWPKLRELAWNRTDRWIPATEALALYERNWRFVEPDRLRKDEADLIQRLRARYGGGMLNA